MSISFGTEWWATYWVGLFSFSARSLLEGRVYRKTFALCLAWSNVTGSSVLLVKICAGIVACLTPPDHTSSALLLVWYWTNYLVCVGKRETISYWVPRHKRNSKGGDCNGQPCCLYNWSPTVCIAPCRNWWRHSMCLMTDWDIIK